MNPLQTIFVSILFLFPTNVLAHHEQTTSSFMALMLFGTLSAAILLWIVVVIAKQLIDRVISIA